MDMEKLMKQMMNQGMNLMNLTYTLATFVGVGCRVVRCAPPYSNRHELNDSIASLKYTKKLAVPCTLKTPLPAFFVQL